jgi:hypothetical protein
MDEGLPSGSAPIGEDEAHPSRLPCRDKWADPLDGRMGIRLEGSHFESVHLATQKCSWLLFLILLGCRMIKL